MQIRSIAVNAAGLAQERGIQGNMPQVQPEKNGFGPECRVTISREGKALSHQQTAQQAEKRAQGTHADGPAEGIVLRDLTLTGQQEEHAELKKAMADMFKKVGYKGDELRERTERFYEIFCRTNPFRGGIQQIMVEDPTEEELAAMNERARQSREHMDKILKSFTTADYVNVTPLTFDYVATLPDMPENESQE